MNSLHNTPPTPAPFFLVVHSDHSLDPLGPNSGAEMATINQARYLAKAGFRTVVAAILPQGSLTDRGVEYWDIGASYDVEAALLRADQIGPYHLVCAGRSLALFFARRRPLCKSRVLITHDRTAGDSGIRPDVLALNVDKILCVSHAQRAKLIEEGSVADKLEVIHNGVDFSIFHASPPPQHDPFKLIFVGALVPDKGLHLLINSFLDLKPRFPQLTLEVYGSASLWSRSEYLDIEQLSKAIPGLLFRGKQPQHQIVSGLQSAGLCVVPSIWFDPYPLTSLEAQACGCPVVTFNVGGLPEGVIDGKTGIVVKSTEQAALTTALGSLLEDPMKLQQMSHDAAQSALERFRWEDVVDKILIASGARALAQPSQSAEAPPSHPPVPPPGRNPFAHLIG